MTKHIKIFLLFMFLTCFLFVDDSYAAKIMDQVLDKYYEAAQSWGTSIQGHATRLFLALATISLVWTMTQLFFRRSSFAEFFGELARFTIFTGFYLWLLRNAPDFAKKIIDSMRQIGGEASGFGDGIGPSGIVDIGFNIFKGTMKGFSEWKFSQSIVASLVAIAILVILTLVAVNMLLLLCSSWVLAYAGIFFLGFGGSRWTSDMAVNYFKTVLGVGASLMTMTMLVGVGEGIMNESLKTMEINPPGLTALNILLVFSITLLLLTDKLPSMVAGIITGASIGQSLGAGAFGAGAAMGAAMTAMAGTKAAMSVAGAGAGKLPSINRYLQGKMLSKSQAQAPPENAQNSTASALSTMGIKPSGASPKNQ